MQDPNTSAAEIVRDLANPKEIKIGGLIPAVLVPAGMDIQKFPEYAPPVMFTTKANVSAHDVAGFIDYVNAFKLETTRLFAALEPKPKLQAFIDYHTQSDPNYCLHIITCDLAHSEEWTRWTKANAFEFDQKGFGTFIEDNAKDVVQPTGSELMQMALNFSSLREVEFGSATRLNNGEVQFSYKEKEKTGEVKLPERIRLGLPVFRGDEQAYSLWARVKYQIKDQKLKIWFELERPDLVVDAAYKAVIKDVADKTGIAPFRGMPVRS